MTGSTEAVAGYEQAINHLIRLQSEVGVTRSSATSHRRPDLGYKVDCDRRTPAPDEFL
jgi:hypothetical protein